MQVSSYFRITQHIIRKYSKNFLVLFCALGMQIAASYSAYAEPIDPPEDPLGKAIFESLNCSDSHHRPGKALMELLTELEKLDLVGAPQHSCLSSSRDRLSSLRFNMSLVAQDSWYWYHRGKMDVWRPEFDLIDNTKNWTAGAQWLRDRSHYNLIVEEASHAWVDRVGVETALRQTPRYATFLAETGVPFDPEAYIYAILEEKGRRMVNFETDRYWCRGVYRDWLKENGGIKKLRAVEVYGSPLKTLPQTPRVPRTPFSLPRSIANGTLSPVDIILSGVHVGYDVASENYGAPWSKTAAVRRQMEAYDYLMTHGIPATGVSAPGYVPVEVTRERSNWQSWNLNAEAKIRRDCKVLGHTVPDELGMGLMKELMLREGCKVPKRPACLPAP